MSKTSKRKKKRNIFGAPKEKLIVPIVKQAAKYSKLLIVKFLHLNGDNENIIVVALFWKEDVTCARFAVLGYQNKTPMFHSHNQNLKQVGKWYVNIRGSGVYIIGDSLALLISKGWKIITRQEAELAATFL